MDDQELLQYIVCPVCKGKLTQMKGGARSGFVCPACGVVYPIENEIPMLLPESGEPLRDWQGGE